MNSQLKIFNVTVCGRGLANFIARPSLFKGSSGSLPQAAKDNEDPFCQCPHHPEHCGTCEGKFDQLTRSSSDH